MARSPKSKGISLEELMVAQQRMMQGGELSERQVELAQKQVERLTEIKNAVASDDVENAQQTAGIQRITRPRPDSRGVGLVDVRNEIRNLKNNLRGLPKLIEDKKSKDEKAAGIADKDRTEILRKIGEVIGEKTTLERGGGRNETLTARNQATFEKFVQTTQEREKLLADADDKQREIFQSLEETLLNLREAGSEDSEKLRRELDKLSGQLKETRQTAARSNIGARLENAQRMSAGGDRGAGGTFGDALAALFGKRQVLKPGYSFDSTLRGAQIRGPQGAARPEEARAGRLQGFGAIVGNLAAGSYERYLESKRSSRVQSFFNNFRSSESVSRISELQGRQSELMSQLGGTSNIAGEPAGADPGMLMGNRSPAEAMTRDGGRRLASNVVNITGKVVNLKGPIKMPARGAATAPALAATSNAMFSDAGGVESQKEDPADRIVAAIKELTGVVREQGMSTGIPGVDAGRGGVSIPTLLMGATIGTVVVGGTALTMATAGVMNTPGAESLRKSYENPMLGAMDPDNAMGASILQNMPKDEQEYQDRQKQIANKREMLKDAPWYTRLYGIGESDYLREQQQRIEGSQRTAGMTVKTQSTFNNVMREQNNQPTIITMPAPSAPTMAPVSETTIMPARASVRPEENGLQRYLNRTHGSYIY